MKEYALIGNPLVHSFSKKYFTEKFNNENIDAKYINAELPDIGDLMEFVAEHPHLQGFNVTIPYKSLIIPYLDGQSEEVFKIGACNTVKIIRNGQGLNFMGYNTDYSGFKESIKQIQNPEKRTALVLGTGGASKAAKAALQDLDYTVKTVSRNANNGDLTYDALNEVINDYFIIVNATPLGTYPAVDTCPEIPFDVLSPNHLCYDLVYNPGLTEFMKRSSEKGCAVKNGLEMLYNQAECSWKIWNE